MSPVTNYPFNAFKISKFNIRTHKRAISKSEIFRIINQQPRFIWIVLMVNR